MHQPAQLPTQAFRRAAIFWGIGGSAWRLLNGVSLHASQRLRLPPGKYGREYDGSYEGVAAERGPSLREEIPARDLRGLDTFSIPRAYRKYSAGGIPNKTHANP